MTIRLSSSSPRNRVDEGVLIIVPATEANAAPRIRTEPVQERSAARIDALLDAAADVVDEVGFDRLTTAMVAERASASIGTVYRYFPDRIVLLQALRERAIGRYRAAVAVSIRDHRPAEWPDAVERAVDTFVGLFRTEPGFRIMRFVEADREPRDTEDRSNLGALSGLFAEMLVEEYGVDDGDEFRFRIGIALEVGDALISRAFLREPAGDEKIIAEARHLVRDYLAASAV